MATNKNPLALFQENNVPDHVRKFNEDHGNIADKISVNGLTYPGKIWTVVVDGNKTPLMKTNEDGDQEPRQTIPLVILDYAKRRGRKYFSGGFDASKPQQPDCWSADGITPDKDARELQAAKCAECPMSVKGSKQTDAGKDTTACQSFRNVAVMLHRKWDLPPLRLQLAITSDYDATGKEHEAKGWFAFQQLTDLLRSRGVKHTASVVVKAKFDTTVNYPKVLFSPTDWLTPDEIDIVQPISESPEVAGLLSPSFTQPGAEKPPAEEQAEETGPKTTAANTRGTGKPAAAKPGKPASRKQPEPEPEPEEEAEEEQEEEAVEGEIVDEGGEDATEVNDIVEETEEEEEDEDPEEAAQRAAEEARQRALKKQQDKAAKAAQQRKAAAASDDDEGDVTLGAPVNPKPTGKPQAGKPAATGKPASKPAQTAAQTSAKPAANGSGKPAAGKTTAAAATGSKAGVKQVSPATAAVLNDWENDD